MRWWLPILIWLTLIDTFATYVMFDVFSLPDDSLKAGLLAYAIRRGADPDRPYRLDSLSKYFYLLTTSTICFATVALVSAPSLELWTGFWMGDLLAVTMICPLFFLEQAPKPTAQKVESILTVTVFLIVARLLFGPDEFGQLSAFEYPYLLLPFLLWASIRLPDRVVAASTITIAAFAVYYTGRGHGPFLALPVRFNDQVLVLQAFLLIITTSPVLLSLGLFERKAASGLSRQYRKELADSEKTYRLLFETSAVAIAVLRERSLVQMNRALLKLFQVQTEEDLLTMAPLHQNDGRLSKDVADELYQTSKSDTVTTIWTARASDGTEFDLDISLFSLPSSEDTVLTAIDITTSNQLLEMLESERASLADRVELRANELAQANTALSRSVRGKQEFVAHLSHELKTPLTSLIAQSETLLEELFGPLNSEQRKALLELRKNGERLSRLVIDILELHRLEMNAIAAEIQPVELESLLQDVMEDFRKVQERRNLTFSNDTQPVTIQTDPILAKRVLSLLLSRAARQSETNASFGLRTERWSELNRVDVTVWDTGPQLPPETFQSMDDPYSARSEGTERAETGLTLALVSGYLKLVQGDLTGRSHSDGTLLTVSFPMEAE